MRCSSSVVSNSNSISKEGSGNLTVALEVSLCEGKQMFLPFGKRRWDADRRLGGRARGAPRIQTGDKSNAKRFQKQATTDQYTRSDQSYSWMLHSDTKPMRKRLLATIRSHAADRRTVIRDGRACSPIDRHCHPMRDIDAGRALLPYLRTRSCMASALPRAWACRLSLLSFRR